MSTQPRVVEVVHLGERRLRIVFSDGLVRELDFSGVLRGALSVLDNDEAFARATVDTAAGTVSWPGGFDLDPDVLHGDQEPADGCGATVIKEYRLQSAG